MLKKLMLTLFMAIIILPNLTYFIVRDYIPHRNTEKRTLAPPPQFTLDNIEQLPGEIEAYINDHAAFKNQVTALYSVINLMMHSVDNSAVILGKDGWYFYSRENEVNDYLGTNLLEEETLQMVADYLSAIKSYCDDNGKIFVFYIAPNKSSIYGQYMPDSYRKVGDYNLGDQLSTYLRQNTDIPVVYPKEQLREAASQTQVYRKLDSHWNKAGAFLGAQPIVELCGGTPTNLDTLEIEYLVEREGDLSLMLNLPQWICDDTEPEIISGFTADVPDENQSMLLIHDSFGGIMEHVLVEYFDDIEKHHITQTTYRDIADSDADVVVMETVERNLLNLLQYLMEMSPGHLQ